MAGMIRWFLIVGVLVAGGWSVWWYAAARGQEAGVEAWLENQRDRGWLAEAKAVEVEGYPLDFRMTATEVNLSDPRSGWYWAAPLLKATSLAYEPTRIEVTWPESQVFAVPGDQAEIRSDDAETILDVRPGPSMELRQAATDVRNLTVRGQLGWNASAQTLSLNVAERAEDLGPPNSYELTAEAVALNLPKQIVEQIDPTGWLKPKVDRFTVKAHGSFEEPLGRASFETGEAILTAATIREAGFQWGAMKLVLTGQFRVDYRGYPEGTLDIEAHEWRQMIRLAVRSDIIDHGTGKTITKAIEFVNALAGGRDELRAPLKLRDGKIRLGTIRDRGFAAVPATLGIASAAVAGPAPGGVQVQVVAVVPVGFRTKHRLEAAAGLFPDAAQEGAVVALFSSGPGRGSCGRRPG